VENGYQSLSFYISNLPVETLSGASGTGGHGSAFWWAPVENGHQSLSFYISNLPVETLSGASGTGGHGSAFWWARVENGHQSLSFYISNLPEEGNLHPLPLFSTPSFPYLHVFYLTSHTLVLIQKAKKTNGNKKKKLRFWLVNCHNLGSTN
jgi:hypothetical protein